MNGKSVAAFISIGITVAIVLSGALWSLASRISAIETRQGVMWKVLVEDALSEAIRHGEIRRNSPYVVTDSLMNLMIVRLSADADSALIEQFFEIVTRGDLPEGDAELAELIVTAIGIDRLLTRSRIFKMSPSNYLALWTVLVRQVERIGFDEFVKLLPLDVKCRERYIREHAEAQKRKKKK